MRRVLSSFLKIKIRSEWWIFFIPHLSLPFCLMLVFCPRKNNQMNLSILARFYEHFLPSDYYYHPRSCVPFRAFKIQFRSDAREKAESEKEKKRRKVFLSAFKIKLSTRETGFGCNYFHINSYDLMTFPFFRFAQFSNIFFETWSWRETKAINHCMDVTPPIVQIRATRTSANGNQ